MAIALYNPRYTKGVDEEKIENRAGIKSFVWSHARWNLGVNEIKKFPDEVGRALLKHYEFLIEVTPQNVAEVKKLAEEKKLKCKYCEYETAYAMALSQHEKKHKDQASVGTELDGIEEAKPSAGKYVMVGKRIMSPEESEGIPDTSSGSKKDSEGTEWYGGGLEQDTDK